MRKRNIITSLILSLSLVSYTGYVLLDTFAIPRVYKVVENTSYEDQQSQNTDDAQETRESSGKVYMNKVAKKEWEYKVEIQIHSHTKQEKQAKQVHMTGPYKGLKNILIHTYPFL